MSVVRDIVFSRFTECKWSIPRGESCTVGPSSPECSVENMVHFIGDSNNCSIRIDKVQNDENGEWKVLRLIKDRTYKDIFHYHGILPCNYCSILIIKLTNSYNG